MYRYGWVKSGNVSADFLNNIAATYNARVIQIFHDHLLYAVLFEVPAEKWTSFESYTDRIAHLPNS